MQKLTITTLTLMLLTTMLVASLLSGIVTMLAGLQEYSHMALPADGAPAAQSTAQPKIQRAVQATVSATIQDRGIVLK